MQTEVHSDGTIPAGPGPQDRRRPGELAWPVAGAAAGALGALVIAVFFLVVDLAVRQALWTPSALGAALFLGPDDLPAEPHVCAVRDTQCSG